MTHSDAFNQISTKLQSIGSEDLTNLNHGQYEEMIYEKIGHMLLKISDKNVLLMLLCLCFRLDWSDLCPPCHPPHCLPCPIQEPHCYNCLATGCQGHLLQIPALAQRQGLGGHFIQLCYLLFEAFIPLTSIILIDNKENKMNPSFPQRGTIC